MWSLEFMISAFKWSLRHPQNDARVCWCNQFIRFQRPLILKKGCIQWKIYNFPLKYLNGFQDCYASDAIIHSASKFLGSSQEGKSVIVGCIIYVAINQSEVSVLTNGLALVAVICMLIQFMILIYIKKYILPCLCHF